MIQYRGIGSGFDYAFYLIPSISVSIRYDWEQGDVKLVESRHLVINLAWLVFSCHMELGGER